MARPATILLMLTLIAGATAGHAAEVTPSELYAQVVRIEQEIAGLKRHFGVVGEARVEPKSGDLKPRHAWAECYIILLKLGKLRRHLGLTYIEPVNIEPLRDMPPNQPWGMTQRILGEIAILKFYLDIPGDSPAAQPVTGKRPIDAYNRLQQVSAELELLTSPVTPSEVYGEVKRLNADVNALLRHLRIFERAMPPPRRENLQPRDSLRAVFEVMGEIQRLQRAHSLDTTDFKGFETDDKTVPGDVFGLVAFTLAELQRVKAQIGMTHAITAPAVYEENKSPADVVQLLGYIANKLHEIRSR
ncbi:MAG: hypothetical protein WCP34_00420 [Pseudomonadota bacterium]